MVNWQRIANAATLAAAHALAILDGAEQVAR
jgi:hypothetical protein